MPFEAYSRYVGREHVGFEAKTGIKHNNKKKGSEL
jgi:hypothetical protein